MLRVNNIEVVYMNVIQVLRGVSLEVADGKIVALLGANGAGKTTTLKAISGMLRTEEGDVTDGSIEFEGKRIDRYGPEDIAAMGMSQAMEGRRVLQHLTVAENLLVGAYRRKDRAGVREDLEMVYDYFPKIKEMGRRTSGYLSGGEQQMLVIGRALMARPRLMLLDEPSLGLAPLIVEDINQIIRRINAEQKTAILLVEQNARAALGIADYGYVMENGKVVLSGPAEKLRDNEDVREFYLGLSAGGSKRATVISSITGARRGGWHESRVTGHGYRVQKSVPGMVTGEMKKADAEKGDTWPKVLKYNHETYGDDRKAMRHKHYGIWQPYTWRDYYLNVKSLARGLLSLGLEPGDKLLIVGDNAPQWYYAELAAQANHGVSVGVYSDSTAQEIEYVARNSEARFAIVEDQEQVDKLLDIKENLPLLKKVIYWDYKGLAHYDDPVLMGYGQVMALGEQCDRDQPGVFEQMVETGRADDVCALVYTSGATGAAPKAAVHTYRTMRASADFHLQLDPWHGSDDVVPYLPPAAMTEQWLNVGCHLLSAGILNFAEKPETQQRDTREIGPTIAVYDARLWEGQAAAVRARMVGIDALKRLVFHLFMPIGYRMADLRFQKKRSSAFLKLLYFLADVVLFKPVRASLGLSHARICYSTGGTLSPDALRFYHALNLTLKSVYGTTEGGALTGATNDDIRLETVGRVYNGTDVRITDEGEIVYRGPGVFLGYYKEPDKSAGALRDGWFYTGDSGLVTEDGQLLFLDRVRDLVTLANGDKLAPQFIESRLRSSPFIKDAWVVAGPDGAFVSAVIVINYDTVGRWAGQRRVAYSTFAELSQRPEIYGLVNEEIERINSALPAACRVRKYVNLHREFDPDEGELTRTRKLRKMVLEKRYRGLIDAIYGEESEVLTDVRVRYPDGRVGTAKTSLGIKAIEGATE